MSEDFDKTRPPLRITIAPEMDATMPGRRVLEPIAEPADIDATMPGKRDRKDDGRFAVGDLIMNRYKVLSELGQGGMGVVYRCLDETAGVEVALKALPPELSHNTLEMEDIKENFQLVSQLVHQNIVVLKQLERNIANGNYYLIMECCEGEDLRRWIKRKRKEGTLTLEAVLPIIQQVAAALDYAHSEKIIHRDIKPGNIMIDQSGKIKVLDFGLAAQIHTSMTRVSMAYHGTSGTGPYMAPEQWRGRQQDAHADQYALAVMTYEMLAGHLPFESSDAAVLKQAVLDENPAPVKNIPNYASAAIDRAMSKEPAERFESCSEFAAALSGKKISGGKVQKKSGYIKWTAMLIISLLLLAGGVGYYFFDRHQKEQAVQEQIAAGNAEIERLSKIVAENAEKERQAELAAEKAEKERQAKIAAEKAEKAEKERLAKLAAEKAEKERLAKLAAEAEKQGLILSADKSTVTDVKDNSIRHCSIPNGITSIGGGAFADCKYLTSITIPNSVTSIGNSAFGDCESLTSITIPNSVTSIDNSAFRGCKSLTSITIPNSVTSIGSFAFNDCESLTSITIPNSVTSIGFDAFEGCKSLTSITIPNSVTSIGDGAFWGCKSLTSITIPNSVTSIDKRAFMGCESLTSITIPNSVTSIGDYAFRGCSKLTGINIPDSIVNMPWDAFDNIKSIIDSQNNPNFYFDNRGVLINRKTTALLAAPRDLSGNYTIPLGITSIGNSAFEDCKSLTSITIPNSVTSIGYSAFERCKSLTSINIPDSIVNMPWDAFYNIKSIIDSQNNPNFYFDNRGVLINRKTNALLAAPSYLSGNYTIPHGITSIGNGAFAGCGLTSITIPNSVTSIGDRAFVGCKSLTSITIPAHFTDKQVRSWWLPENCRITRR